MVDPRPKIPVYFLRLAELVATRATCARRAVGCVLTDAGNRVLATGYNGVPVGEPHCAGEAPCPGAGQPSGTGLDRCEAIHAEQNALLQLRRGSDEVRACYSTTFPCAHCLKLLLNTGCVVVYYRDDYPGGEGARQRWGHRLTFTRVAT